MKRLLHRLSQWWFPVVPAERLGLLRVATGAYSLWYMGNRVDLLAHVAVTDPELFAPVSVVQLLSQPLAPDLFAVIVWSMLVLNLCFLLGLAHRYTGPLFAAALYFVLCYRNSWSMVYHSHGILIFHVLILGITRAADGISVDAWLKSRKSATAEKRAPSAEYGWPLQLICMITLVSYFLAGFAKVATPVGFGWAAGEAMRGQVGVDALRKEVLGSEIGLLAPFLFEHIWLFTVMGVATLILELGAPLVMVNRRLSQIWCIAAIGMHWGIFLIMGIRFRYQMCGAMYLSFFSLEKLLRPLKRFRNQGDSLTSTRIN